MILPVVRTLIVLSDCRDIAEHSADFPLRSRFWAKPYTVLPPSPITSRSSPAMAPFKAVDASNTVANLDDRPTSRASHR